MGFFFFSAAWVNARGWAARPLEDAPSPLHALASPDHCHSEKGGGGAKAKKGAMRTGTRGSVQVKSQRERGRGESLNRWRGGTMQAEGKRDRERDRPEEKKQQHDLEEK